MAEHNELGKLGEKAVIEYLQKQGYNILAHNWYCDKNEIDIIAQNNEWIIFVEVKTRSSQQWGNPEDSISEAKMKRIVDAADNYIQMNDIEKSARFDIASVIVDNSVCNIEYFEDAFLPPVM